MWRRAHGHGESRPCLEWPHRMRALPGFLILVAFLALGEGLSRVLRLPLPGAVLGLALLWAALAAGLVRAEWVEGAADTLLGALGLLFVPAGAGVVAFLDPAWLVAAPVLVLGGLAGLAAVGRLAQGAAPPGDGGTDG